MELSQVQQVLENYKPGTYIKVCWEKDISSARAKKNGVTIIKKCEALVRTAIKYTHIKGIVPKSYENSEWETWFEHSDVRGMVQHKNDESKKYLQLYPINGKKIKTKIVATVETDNLENLYKLGFITKASLPQESVDEDEVRVMTLSLDNITKFGSEYCMKN